MAGCVVTHQPLAAEAGAEVLRRGGNAVDAAVATAFVQTVVDPQMAGIAGLGVMTLYLTSTGDGHLVDFYERAPLAATPGMYEALEDQPVAGGLYLVKDFSNQMGYLAVSAPGTLLGLFEALTRYGTISWADAIAPAAALAEEGFPVHEDLYRYWTRAPRAGDVDNVKKLTATPECARVYLKDGRFLQPGERMVLPDYARTLRRIVAEGPDVFYRGEIAAAIDADFRQHGGLLSLEDLRQYRVMHADPLVGHYRGHVIITNDPPGSGGTVLETLNILEHFDLAGIGHNSTEYIHTLAQAAALAFQDRAVAWGDPRFETIPLNRLLSPEHTRELVARVRAGGAVAGTLEPAPEDTTHLSVIDAKGNAVALTHTLGTSAGVVTPGLGFLYNNGMHRFWPKPGSRNSVAPGKSRVSSLSPTVVLQQDRVAFVTGASGGYGIVSGVVQSILNFVDHKMSAIEAVAAPRIHCEGPVLQLEARIPRQVARDLERRGHKVQHTSRSYDQFAGVVAAIGRSEAGRVLGGADPRRGGTACYTD